MSAILSVRGLSAHYSLTQVLRDVSFELARGGITAILGANGAGKTTTLRAICGMVSVSGEILLDGRRIDRLATERIAALGVAHVPDGRGTIGALTVEENLRVGAFTRRDRGVAADIAKVYEYFPRLQERARQHAGELSGGEQQMLAISRALMLRPKVLLLDEPSFGLAPLVIRDIFAILRTINRADGVSMLLVEQNASLALDLADHASLLETGSIVMAGTSTEIQKNDAIRQSYLGY